MEDRKRLEEALRESQERLRVTAQAAKVGTFEWRFPSNVSIWTPELEALYGLPPGGLGEGYEAWAEHVHPDDRVFAQARVHEALRTGSFTAEWRTIWPDGTVRWIEARGWVERDAEGRPMRMIGVNLDVTARKEVEEALRKLDEVRRLALASAQMGTLEIDVATGLVRWDERARALFGFGEPEVSLADAVERIHPDDRPMVRQMIDEVPASDGNGTYDMEFRTCPAEGATCWLRSVGQVLFEHRHGVREPVRFVGILMDTTERKEAEAALRESEERFRVLVEAASQAVWEADAQGVVTKDSPSWRAYTGQTIDQWLGYGWATAIHPEDREQAERAWRQGISTQCNIDSEFRIRSRGGGWRWTNVHAAPIRDPDGTITKWVGMNIDVTDRKRAEEALQEEIRRKDEYLAMLGHELRNPLAAIRTAGDVIKHGSGTVPTLARAAAVLERQSAHMGKLLDGLLDVSRITRGTLRIERSAVDLVGILRDVLSDHADQARRKGVHVRTELPQGALWLHGDPARLTQIFDNLLGNAVKFTAAGGQVLVAARAHGDEAEVVVRDTGIGLSPELRERLFQAFQQGPQDISRSTGGLGLGLALTRGLVELHGGTVRAHSEGVGQGAEFMVRIPLERSGRSPHAADEPTDARGPVRILVIEDNEDSAEMLRQVLELRGHAVQVATRGREGIERAKDECPDVILCDLGLPDGMSGFDVARELRRDPRTREIWMVALTGYGRPEDKARCAEAGFDDHLTKPVDLPTLERMLARVGASRGSGDDA